MPNHTKGYVECTIVAKCIKNNVHYHVIKTLPD